ncbi:hsp70 nucleotide exchange factor fes1 [Cryptotrichosporon argae]
MPDINSLLRWAVENSTQPQAAAADAGADDGPQLSLRFRPHSSTPAHTATLHSSDPYHPSADVSPASTPGPATPVDGPSELPPPARREDLTTEMLDLIMGKSDSVTMKEKMAAATDESNEVEVRVDALDDFEMLIELIDNANNMAVLKLWQPLLALLQSPHPEIVRHALWVIGTAVQNNPKAQAALYVHDALPAILSLLSPPTPSASASASASTPASAAATRAKATYALSSALKHWPLAASALAASSGAGYAALRHGVADADGAVRRKMAFLVSTLVMQAGETYEGEMPAEVRALVEEHTSAAAVAPGLLDGLGEHGVLSALTTELGKHDDVEFDENAVRALARASAAGGLGADEKSTVARIWGAWGAAGQAERGLDGEDGQEIARALA